MGNELLSVGLDVGTTSTQLVVSRLRVENRAGSFAVPEMAILDREILYKSPVHFTPLIRDELVDAPALRKIVENEYKKAGIRRENVDTGAIIITGETSRKENAEAVLHELSGFAGEFVVATAGPDLESVLAARGAGAAAWSEDTGKQVLHMDIGGGTSNLALIRDGNIIATGCLNVGGRLIKLDQTGALTYVSPVLRGLWPLDAGQRPGMEDLEELAWKLVQALEMAAGLRQRDGLLDRFITAGTELRIPEGDTVISFSGGVADCIEKEQPWNTYGDLGPVLGRAIRESRLCRGEYRLGSETIRATVIGAGCHSTQLSGSTIFYRNVEFPLKNLPVVAVPWEIQNSPELGAFLRREMAQQETAAVIALPGLLSPDHETVRTLAKALSCVTGKLLVCLETDMAKALGQALALELGPEREILCLDRVKLPQGSYLDVGAPLGPALPVVVKTLAFER